MGNAPAKRLVEYYPMIKDKSAGCRHESDGVANKLLKRLSNIRSPMKAKHPPFERAGQDREPSTVSDYDADSSASTPSDDPDTYIHRCMFSSPVLLVGEENCIVVVGTTPVLTFYKDLLHEGPLYLLAYYHAFYLTYPK
ncbi:hypothetical protein HF521_021940 [Silurus meridionalis]|uniref:Uncharacterized protein n=1 Tax=Silurus meridionalis TaxID=175797 RepID=A0A8T0BCK4_SILME|nr:hypothetical protein HF521_021940 [Silurus meridionalis]